MTTKGYPGLGQRSSATPRHAIAVLALLLLFDGCGLSSGLAEAHKQAEIMASAIETRVGVKPEISFNIFNGKLVRLSLEFPALPAAALPELEKTARQEVLRAFKSEPDDLVISFVFKKAP